MHRTSTTLPRGLAALLLVFGLAGCDAFEVFDREKEVEGTVEVIAEDGSSLTVDGIEYRITSQTEYEGIPGLADLTVGDAVEIEYEEESGTRVAVEVELAGAEDDDGGL